jgi:hypothetical protein
MDWEDFIIPEFIPWIFLKIQILQNAIFPFPGTSGHELGDQPIKER